MDVHYRNAPLSLQERVANIYYRHGLFCARHPFAMVSFALIVLFFSCYPLIYLPIFKSTFYFKSPFQTPSSTQHWFQQENSPVAHILQIVLKSSVVPWKEELSLQDAFRGPLAQSFALEELVHNHQLLYQNGSAVSLSHLCLQVSEPLKFATFLPHYGCLVISPSHFWKKDFTTFQQDEDIVRTIFSNPELKVDSSNIKEILFGVPWIETGIKRFNVRTRSRVLTFAVTIVLKKVNLDYLSSLQKELSKRYPHFNMSTSSVGEEAAAFLHFNQPPASSHLIPLAITYLLLFFYIYYSVRKIDMVKSKLFLAVSAIITLVLSLVMSLGLCLWFHILPTLTCSEVMPYLMVIIGLENVLVLTKSVVSTPNHIDLKLRVAQGLSKEGWSISKHLLTEIGVLTFAFCTFVPTIQELCLVALVGVLSDFFLQLVFFTTLLSTDLKKIEPRDLCKGGLSDPNDVEKIKQENCHLLYTTPVLHRSRNSIKGSTMNGHPPAPILVTLPKRLRFVYFCARTRMIQRFLMVCLIGWIVWLLYISGFVDQLTMNIGLSSGFSDQVLLPLLNIWPFWSAKSQHSLENRSIEQELFHHDPELWRQLPPQHWSTLLGYYNISLLGRSISILPPLLLSAPVPPTFALDLHPPTFNVENPPTELDGENEPPEQWPLYVLLSLPTMITVAYIMVVLYRCMCSRHYAEWRSSWWGPGVRPLPKNFSFHHYTAALNSYLVVDHPPINVQGHSHELEEMATHSNLVVSSCLTGDVLVWDLRSGECINLFLRNKKETPEPEKDESLGHRRTDSNSSDKLSKSTSSQPLSIISGQGFDDHLSDQVAQSLGYDFRPYLGTLTEPCSCLNSSTHSLDLGGNEEDETGPGEDLVEESRIHYSPLPFQPVWCLDCYDSIFVLGCANGRIEVWNAYSGEFLGYSENTAGGIGITSIKLIGKRIYLARLDGNLEFYLLEYDHDNLVNNEVPEEQSILMRLHTLKPHNQPITQLIVHKGHIFTGSQDHLIKVYKAENVTCIFTLNGHIGGITALHIDMEHAGVVSGCAGGMICMWDLGTGRPTCAYSLRGCHNGSVTLLRTTYMYLISSGTDSRIIIWEKSQGHLLHTLQKDQSFCDDFVLLNPNIMVTAKENQLLLWDVNHGEALRMIVLKRGDPGACITKLRLWGQTLVCGYSSQLYAIHFQGTSEKMD